MAEYRESVSECSAYTLPNSESPIVATLQRGTVVRVIRDDDKRFLRAAVSGQPLYIEKSHLAASSEERFLAFQTTDQGTALTNASTSADREDDTIAGIGDRFVGAVIDVIIWNVVLFSAGVLLRVAITSQTVRIFAALFAALVVLGYATYLNANGGTWGKRFAGIRIVQEHSAAAPGMGRAIIRLFFSFVSAIPLYLGYFWMIWDKKKRTWHDIAAGTIVVRSNWHVKGIAKE